MLLATGDGAEGFIIFAVNVVAFALAGARDETVRMVSIYRQGKEGEAVLSRAPASANATTLTAKIINPSAPSPVARSISPPLFRKSKPHPGSKTR